MEAEHCRIRRPERRPAVRRGGGIVCARCGTELAPWEELYLWREGAREHPVCSDCFDALVRGMGRREQAERLGMAAGTVASLSG